MKSIALLIGIGFVTLSGCTNKGPEPITNPVEKPYVTTPYNLENPVGFPDRKIAEDNPTTLEGVSLGRMLYYDHIMDKDSSRACASCHIQSQAFQTDNGSSQVLEHVNLSWSTNFMWNGSFQGTLEDVMTFEVEEFLKTDLTRLNNSEKYRDLFKKAFNVDVITSKEAAYALAQFERILTSSNSRFDKFLRGEVILTPQELTGFDLFNTEKADCFHCHGTALFTDNTPRNNGLDLNPADGYMAVTGNPKDLGRFKTPTLRNIELTAPYMHDGRFATLEDVVDFYSTGVHNTATVDPLMVYAYQGGVQLSTDEKAALIAFLKTLTDTSYLANPELSNPF
tara:strand:+ start:13617 stop:14630 length:1014 start_codon:yes stop_codon:yes gene_type:complete